MSDETTRAAAERLRQYYVELVSIAAIWGLGDDVSQRFQDDNMRVARDVVRNMPADDAELIDARWITDHCPVSTFGNLGTHGDLGPFQLWASGTGGNELRCHTFTKSNATRGDVRRLCAALGIPLTPPSPTSTH